MIKSVSNGSKILYTDSKYKFWEAWDSETGFYLRSDVLNKDGTSTDKDAFMRSYPVLIDVGIMGHCEHGKSGLCVMAGVQCYQNGLGIEEPNMSVSDYKSILEQSEGKLMQIALGGRGDPNKHEHFGEILKLTRDYGIVPNYTTSGLKLTDNEVALTKKYCGAVAVSWYRSQYTIDALQSFMDAGCVTNIHYVLGNNSIDEAIERLQNDSFPEGVNAIIFLLHKPVGLGTSKNVLQSNDPRVKTFFSLVDNWNGKIKIGFDSCSIPGLLNFTSNIDGKSMDTCEGGRFSAYITPDMKMTTCSFDHDNLLYAVDLRENTIQEAWDSETFNKFRSYFKNRCPNCAIRESCMGGCPIKPEIVLCNRKEKTQ